MWQNIIDFVGHPFFDVIGCIEFFILLLGFIYSIYLITSGILPVLIRLGKGLSNRKIAIYAESDFTDLKQMLIDSGLFKEKNIVQITKNSLKKGKDYTIMLVNYPEFNGVMDKIIVDKADSDALIVYAPIDKGKIDEATMKNINEHRNAIVANFRGRLMNDILVCMITTVHARSK